MSMSFRITFTLSTSLFLWFSFRNYTYMYFWWYIFVRKLRPLNSSFRLFIIGKNVVMHFMWCKVVFRLFDFMMCNKKIRIFFLEWRFLWELWSLVWIYFENMIENMITIYSMSFKSTTVVVKIIHEIYKIGAIFLRKICASNVATYNLSVTLFLLSKTAT